VIFFTQATLRNVADGTAKTPPERETPEGVCLFRAVVKKTGELLLTVRV
jgi:hypothetical protein